MMMNIKWRLWAPFLLLTVAAFKTPLAAQENEAQFTVFNADYIVYRAGKKHGEAKRFLKPLEQGYLLGYSSDISWFIFSDKRSESSYFTLNEGQIQPYRYIMSRTGTGSDRYYELNLDQSGQKLATGKEKTLKETSWRDDWLDQLSYQQQLVLDLRAGKTTFSYNVLNRHGDSKRYDYAVVAEETLALPYGELKTLRISRLEDDDKQIYAWVAPELDYLLVRLWRGEKNVEQFDVQLHKLDFPE